jgi:hypothetical protein
MIIIKYEFLGRTSSLEHVHRESMHVVKGTVRRELS